MLHRVQNELHSKGEANRALVNNIRDRLTQYNSELMDLRDALNEAVNKTRQTEDLNSMNLNNLEESQVPGGFPLNTEAQSSESCMTGDMSVPNSLQHVCV